MTAVPKGEFAEFFCDRVATHLRQTLRTPEAVMQALGCSYGTACNMLQGRHRPTGDKTALLFMAFPDLLRFFVEHWEGRS